jgi:hypothetical protein
VKQRLRAEVERTEGLQRQEDERRQAATERYDRVRSLLPLLDQVLDEAAQAAPGHLHYSPSPALALAEPLGVEGERAEPVVLTLEFRASDRSRRLTITVSSDGGVHFNRDGSHRGTCESGASAEDCLATIRREILNLIHPSRVE